MIRHAFVVFALLAASLASAQEPQDPEKVKNEILDKVRARLKEEHRKIMKRIAAIIDDELGAKPEKAAPADSSNKKVRDLQKKLAALEDQRDEILKEMRTAKREKEDADIRKEAKSIPEDEATVQQMFDEALQQHEAQDFKTSIASFKTLYYRFPKVRFGAVSAYNVACGYALTGDKEQALDWLELSIEAGYGEESNDYDHIRQDSDLDTLRKERRYQKIMLDK
ncbi:MAG: hypothetical protein HYY16_09335 [Planctomycetes bacterium]|nr:hypothetical protein [Planctomycetota bacterium]